MFAKARRLQESSVLARRDDVVVTGRGRRGLKQIVKDVRQRTDADLLAATRGDPGAFAVFYERYEKAVVGYLARRTKDAELAADLTAEVFAAALRSAHTYAPHSPTAAAWLFTIAQHTLARSIRRGRVEARARHRLGIREAFELDTRQIEQIEASMGGDQWVLELLEHLPPDQMQAVRARVLDELPYEQIAQRMQTSELVIRKRVSRGLATLREGLEEQS
jgi:RNA polymerase sigma factor (sigma-70 family)